MLKRGGESDDEWGGPGAPLDVSLPITISWQEHYVQLAVGNKTIDFFVDTGATHLVLNTKLTKKSSAAVMVTGVPEQAFCKQAFLQPLECHLGDQKLMHS